MNDRGPALNDPAPSAPPQQRDAAHLYGESDGATVRRVFYLVMVIAAGIAIVAAEPNIVFVIGAADAWAAIALWLLTIVEIAVWRSAGLWDQEGIGPILKRSGWGRGLFLPAIATAAFLFPSSEFSVCTLAATFVVLYLFRRRLRKHLQELVPGLPTTTNASDPSDKSGEVSESPVVLGRCIDRKILRARAAASRRLRESIRIAAACATLTMGAALMSTIAVGVGLHTGKWHEKAHTATKTEAEVAAELAKKLANEKPRTSPEGSGRGSPTEESPQPNRCAPIPTQSGISGKVRGKLQSLFTGKHQLGQAATGCALEIKEQATPDGLVYWMLGTEPADQNPKSLAVVSPRFKSALVLWPAAKAVRKIIEGGEDVGADLRHFPRYYAGGGDYYLMSTEKGTIALIQELLGTTTEARPYVTMPVSTTFAWLSAIRESETWLWPKQRNAKDFDLKVTGSSRSRFKIKYKISDGTATRQTLADKTAPYSTSEPAIEPNELRRWVPPISQEEQEREVAQSREEAENREEEAG